MENLHVTTAEGQQVLTIREGAAPLVRQPKGYELSASITSVIDFYKKRSGNPEMPINSNTAYLTIDNNNASVKLVVNDLIVEERIMITGILKEDKDYQDLGINNPGKLFTQDDLERLLRNRPHIFASVDAYSGVMHGLRNFTSKVSLEFSKTDNREGRAGTSKSFDVLVQGLEKEIPLQISPWVGCEKETFNVTIYVTVEAGAPKFYLECVELMLAKEKIKEKALNEVADELKDLPTLYV